MSEVDPWGELGARYEHDEDSQFIVFVEQFAEAQALLYTDSVAKWRMALVAIDNLAEVLLARRIRALYRYGEDQTLAPVRLFDRRERAKLKADFGARVMVGLWAPDDGLLSAVIEPILDELDAEIFRVAHAYRGRVYHADHHNEAVLVLLGRAYLLSVGRTFVRIQLKNIGSSVGARAERLAPFGYRPSDDTIFPGCFVPEEAARSVIGHITRGVSVSLVDARRKLRADLEWRACWADAMVADLASDGFDRARVARALPWTEFWDTHGSDETLVRLARERDEARWVGATAEEGNESFGRRMAAADAAQLAYNDRFRELYGQFKPSLGLDEIGRVRRLARGLSSARTLAALLSRYRQLDDQIERVERALGEIAIGWDKHIQEESDRIRGK